MLLTIDDRHWGRYGCRRVAAQVRQDGEPADVAEAVRWLLLDASYTTGQVIRVDGGRALNI